MRRLIVVVLFVSLTGCAGIGTFTPATLRGPITQSNGADNPRLNKAQVASIKRDSGTTARVESSGGREVWTYDEDNRWCGALIVIIPLVLPVCEHKDIYTFEDGELQAHEIKTTHFSGLICSVVPFCPEGHDCSFCLVK